MELSIKYLGNCQGDQGTNNYPIISDIEHNFKKAIIS